MDPAPPHDDPVSSYQMTVGEHLEELRSHVLRGLLYLALGTAVCLFFQDELIDLVTGPHRTTMGQLAQRRWEAGIEQGADAVAIDGELLRELMQVRVELQGGQDAVQQQARRLAPPPSEALQALLDRGTELQTRQAALLERLSDLAPGAEGAGEALAEEEALGRELEGYHAELQVAVDGILPAGAEEPPDDPERLQFLSYTEVFLSYLKLSIICGLLLSSPLLGYELWRFVAAGLYPHEQRYVRVFAPFSLVAFALGAVFGYLILIPLGLQYLASYGDPSLVTGGITLSDYLSTFLLLTFFVGVAFELPLVMLFCGLIRLVRAEQLARWRKYFLLTAVTLSAFLTPPDVVTQVLLSIPLVILYELGIFLVRAFVRPAPEAGPPP